MLQGQASGALIQANSGQPGAAARVVIRGVGSVNGTTEPLYILDGVQISAGNFASINPNDFESISLLKDASTTAQYGYFERQRVLFSECKITYIDNSMFGINKLLLTRGLLLFCKCVNPNSLLEIYSTLILKSFDAYSCRKPSYSSVLLS
jgi:hypothetical protein